VSGFPTVERELTSEEDNARTARLPPVVASSGSTLDRTDPEEIRSEPPPSAPIGSIRALRVAYAISFAAGLAWTAWLMASSPGVPIHDELGHVRFAAESWQHPSYLLDPWGRPANTLTYAIPARWGLDGARMMSLLIAGATVLLTTRIAQRLGLRLLFIVPLVLWFQPWFNDLSYTALTEVPFSLALVAGVAAALDRRDRWASVAFGLLPLFRHEGIVILGVWGVVCLVRRAWRPAVIAAVPLVVYEIAFALADGRSAFAEVYLEPRETTFYGAGGLSHFLSPVGTGAGWAVLALAVLALPRLRTLRWRALALAPFVLYFATHTVLYRFGLYASGGYGLFLLPLAPALAISAALGTEWLAGGASSVARSRMLRAGSVVATAAVLGVVVYLGVQTDPRPLDREGVTMRAVAAWLDARDVPPESVYTTHAWLNTFYEVPFRPILSNRTTATPLNVIPAGSYLVWDGHYSNRLGWPIEYLSDPGRGWARLTSFGDNLAVVFVKQRNSG
jgi:hypothetical protein